MLSEYLQKLQKQKLGLIAPDEKKKTVPIAKKSGKLKEQEKEYKQIVKVLLKESKLCEINEEGCQTVATGLHHKKKRGRFTLTERKNLMRACNNCQTWVETHPLEAIEKGFSISKHAV